MAAQAPATAQDLEPVLVQAVVDPAMAQDLEPARAAAAIHNWNRVVTEANLRSTYPLSRAGLSSPALLFRSENGGCEKTQRLIGSEKRENTAATGRRVMRVDF